MSGTVITVTTIIISSCNFWCSEKFETILKIFLTHKNPRVANFRPLPQCTCKNAMSGTAITVTIIIINSCNFWCSEKFETILKIFLAPENPQVRNFRPLLQCT